MSSRRAHRLRPPWRALRFFVMALFIAPAVLLAASQTPWGRQRLRALVTDVVQRELGLEARLGDVRIELSALPPSLAVVASELALDDPVYGPLAEADALRIRPSLGALLLGELDLETIALEQPFLHLLLRDGEVRNLPRIESGEGPTKLPFQRLLVRSGRVELDTDVNARVVLAGLDLDVAVTDGRDLALQLDARGGQIDFEAERSAGATRPIRGESERIERFVVTAQLDADEALTIEQAVLRSPSIRLELGQVRVPLPYRDAFSGTVRGRMRLEALARLPSDLGLPALRGQLEVDVDVAMRGDAYSGEGRVRLSDATIASRYGLGELADLHVSFDRQAVQIHDDSFFDVIDHGGHVGVSGRIGLELPLPAEFVLDVRELQLANLLDQIGVTPDTIVWWYLSGRIELQGTLAPLLLRGSITTHTHDFLVTQDAFHVQPRARVLGVDHGRVAGQVRVTDELLAFENLRVDTGRSRIDVNADIGFGQTFRVHAHATRLDLADITPLVDYPLAGSGTLDLRVDGLYDDPTLTGHASFRGFAFDSMPLGDLETDFSMEEGGLAIRFPNIVAKKNESRYRVHDLYLDFSDGRFEATAGVHLDRMTLADAYRIFHLDQDERFASYQGVAQGDVGIRYTQGFPGDDPSGTLTLELGLDLPALEVSGVAFTDGRLDGRWRWLHYDRGVDGAVFDLSSLSLRKGDATVAVAGHMDLGGELHMTVVADRIALEETEGLHESAPGLTGEYALLGTLTGTYEVPHFEADLDLSNMAWEGRALGGARIYLRLTDRDDPWVRTGLAWDPDAPPADAPCAHARLGLLHGRWRPNPPPRTAGEVVVPSRTKPMALLVCGEGLGGAARVDMAIGYTALYPLRGVIELDGLSLAPFAPELEGTNAVEGRLSGLVELTGGDLRTDGSLSGSVTLSELSMAAGGVSLANEGDLRFRMDDGTLEVLEAVMAGDGTRLALTGRGSSRGGLDYALSGSVDLALLSTLTPLVHQGAGLLRMQVRVRGPLDDPAIYGQATIRGASAALRDFSMPVRELRGDVEFSARRVLFTGFEARIGTGIARLEGAATLSAGGLRAVQADLSLEDLLYRPEEGLEMELDAQGRLEWNHAMRIPALHGRILLDRLRYTRPINVSPTIGELYRPERQEVERYDPNADTLELDVEIVQRTPARVRNNLLDMDVVIEDDERPFRIVGTDQRLGVLGSLRIPRGTVRFRNTSLEVHDGSVDFDDPQRVNPRFDVTAITDIRRRQDIGAPNWRISLRAHGSLDGFQLDASSTPSLTQQDIMLLLTIGMTTSEAQQLQAQDLGSVGLEALSAVSGVEGEVSSALGVIDDIQLTTIYHPVTNRPEPQVTIGKRISDRVRLTASTGLTSETRTVQATAEWRLNDQARVQAVYDNFNRATSSSFGNIGLDLRWRLEFE